MRGRPGPKGLFRRRALNPPFRPTAAVCGSTDRGRTGANCREQLEGLRRKISAGREFEFPEEWPVAFEVVRSAPAWRKLSEEQ